MYAPITDQATAEVVKAAPIERQVEAKLIRPSSVASGGESLRILVAGGERAHGRAAQPQVPIQSIGHGRGRSHFGHSLRPTGPSCPSMHLLHFANFAAPENLASHARGIVRIALVAHLRGNLVRLRRLRQ